MTTNAEIQRREEDWAGAAAGLLLRARRYFEIVEDFRARAT